MTNTKTHPNGPSTASGIAALVRTAELRDEVADVDRDSLARIYRLANSELVRTTVRWDSYKLQALAMVEVMRTTGWVHLSNEPTATWHSAGSSQAKLGNVSNRLLERAAAILAR